PGADAGGPPAGPAARERLHLLRGRRRAGEVQAADRGRRGDDRGLAALRHLGAEGRERDPRQALPVDEGHHGGEVEAGRGGRGAGLRIHDGDRQARDAARAASRQDRGEGRRRCSGAGAPAQGRSQSPLMNILVFAEVRDGKLKKSSLETLSEAVRLAKKLGSKVGVALVGEGIKAHAEALGRHGAAAVFAVDSPRLKFYASEAYAKA